MQLVMTACRKSETVFRLVYLLCVRGLANGLPHIILI